MVGFYPVIKVKKFNKFYTPPKNSKFSSMDYEWGKHKLSARGQIFHTEKQAQEYGLDYIKSGYSILILKSQRQYKIYTKINDLGRFHRRYDKYKYKSFKVGGELKRFHSEGHGRKEYMANLAEEWRARGYYARVDQQAGYADKWTYRLYVRRKNT